MSVYSISTGTPFLPTLAGRLLERYGATPEQLARVTVVLPTQRAVVTLRDELLAAAAARGQSALLAPRLVAVTDPDPLGMPTMTALDRHLYLAHLIRKAKGDGMGFAHAFALAETLARLLDELHRHGHTVHSLRQLSPDLASRHWQDMLNILETVWTEFEQTLTQLGRREGVTAQIDTLTRLAHSWQNQPATGPVIAAGLIGLFPYVQAFQRCVLQQPDGQVILQGLDQDLADAVWDTLPADHPQARLKTLLAAIGVDRAQVVPLGPPPGIPRPGLIRQMLLPPAFTPAWRQIRGEDLSPELTGISRIVTDTAPEEALAIACVVRSVVAMPGRTVAIVTANRELAVNVHQQLRRWQILANDSSGTPLRLTPGGVFLHLVAELAGGRFSPVALADLLRHPYTRLGHPAATVDRLRSLIERLLLRGPRLCHRLDQLPDQLRLRLATPRMVEQLAATGHEATDVLDWLQGLLAALQPLGRVLASREIGLDTLITTHVKAAETLARDPDGGLLLWKQQDGQELKRLFTSLLATTPLPQVPASHYTALLRTLLTQNSVHLEQPLHARVHLWGPLEAQLHHADTVIVADLNEQSFPSRNGHDLWLNRAMKAQLGLSLTEDKTGLEAHVFTQLLGADRVILSRARRRGGAPTLPSRWLARLEAMLACVDHALPSPPEQDLAAQLETPPARITLPEPCPAPPAGARPVRYTVSDLDLLSCHPYGFYARRILGLSRLDDLDTEPDAGTRGTLIHDILEAFCRQHPGLLPEHAGADLMQLADARFRDFADNPAVQLFWRARFRRIADWYLAEEQALRTLRQPQAVERKGVWTLMVMNQMYAIEARTDRIDRTTDGKAIVIDYKTGTPPKASAVLQGTGGALQLPLTALILRAGGFAATAGQLPQDVGGIEYWHLAGRRTEGGKRLSIAGDDAALGTLLTESERFLRSLLAAFATAEQGYPVWPLPWCKKPNDDYAHLARQAEWE